MIAHIRLMGCDDSTYFDVEVDEDKLKFLEFLAVCSSNASTYGCEPKMLVSHD